LSNSFKKGIHAGIRRLTQNAKLKIQSRLWIARVVQVVLCLERAYPSEFASSC
jgi:hypothetical protein